MKQIAGPLRLEYARYRELAAFSRFGSDLSKDTLERLRHGERIVELLKQPQYTPMPVERQVLILYVLTNKYLSDVPMKRIADFQNDFFVFVEEHHHHILGDIREKGEISDSLEEDIKIAIKEFKGKYFYNQ